VAERQLKNRLKELRARRGLTQSELAALAGVPRKTVNTVENLIFVPSTALALVLAEALGTRVEDIFYLESEREE
jgi:putative transcriptional regulator